jgi:hypothetical protein
MSGLNFHTEVLIYIWWPVISHAVNLRSPETQHVTERARLQRRFPKYGMAAATLQVNRVAPRSRHSTFFFHSYDILQPSVATLRKAQMVRYI